MVVRGQCGAAVEHHDQQFGALDRGAGAAHAFLLDHVRRGVQAGGIGEAHQHAVDAQFLFNGVARRARLRRHDGAVAAQEGVQQAGLAHVGTADDGHGHAVAQQAAARERGTEGFQLNRHALQSFAKYRLGDQLQVFFGKVDPRFQVDADLYQILAQRAEVAGQGAVELVDGGAVARLGAGVDEVDDRLGLGEVEAPVQERPSRELAGLGHPHTLRQNRFQDTLYDHHAAVATDLRHVLAGVGVRLPHDAEQRLVDALALRVDHKAMIDAVRFQTSQRQAAGPHEDPLRHRYGIRAAEAHHADAANAQRRGDSGDGIVLGRLHTSAS